MCSYFRCFGELFQNGVRRLAQPGKPCNPLVVCGLLAVALVGGYLVFLQPSSRGLHQYAASSMMPMLDRVRKLVTLSNITLNQVSKQQSFIVEQNQNDKSQMLEELTVKNKELEEKLRNLRETMEADSKKSEQAALRLTSQKRVLQLELEKLKNTSASNTDSQKNKLEAEFTSLTSDNTTTGGYVKKTEGISPDSELDEETLQWKRKLAVPTNSDILNNTKEIDPEYLSEYKARSYNESTMNLLFGAFDIWVEIATELKIPWILSQGSLLGSYRGHGYIPWDGDIDVMADIRYKEKFLDFFRKGLDAGRYPGYNFVERTWTKIYPLNGTKPSGFNGWRTPTCDVFYYERNGLVVSGMGHTNEFHAWDIFPRVLRPFQGRMVPGPRDPRAYLMKIFGRPDENHKFGNFRAEHECDQGRYNYLTDQSEKGGQERPCKEMINKYPFVRHIRGEGSAYCKEELVMKGKVLSVFYRSAIGVPAC